MVAITATHLIASLAVAASVSARPIRQDGQAASPAPAARMQRVLIRSSPPPLPAGIAIEAAIVGRQRRPLSRRALRRAEASRRAITNDTSAQRRGDHAHIHEHVHGHAHHHGHKSHHYKDGDLEYELKHHSKHWAQHHGLARRQNEEESPIEEESPLPRRVRNDGLLPLSLNGPGSITLGRRQEGGNALEARRHGAKNEHVHIHKHGHGHGHKHEHHGEDLKVDAAHVHVHTHAHRSVADERDAFPASSSGRHSQHVFAPMPAPPLVKAKPRLDEAKISVKARRGLLGSVVKPLLAPLNAIPGFVTISDLLFGDDNVIKQITSLVLIAQPHTNGTATNSTASDNATSNAYTYSLMASKEERTQVFLWPFKDGQTLAVDDKASNSTVVRIAIPLLNVTSGDPMLMCATFNLTPPSSLQLEACQNSTDPSAASSVAAGKSQRFSYSSDSGVLSPLYAKEFAGSLAGVQSDGSNDTAVASNSTSAARRDNTTPVACNGPSQKQQLAALSSSDSASNADSSSSASSAAMPSSSSDNSTSTIKPHSQVMLLFEPAGMSSKSFKSQVSDASPGATEASSGVTESSSGVMEASSSDEDSEASSMASGSTDRIADDTSSSSDNIIAASVGSANGSDEASSDASSTNSDSDAAAPLQANVQQSANESSTSAPPSAPTDSGSSASSASTPCSSSTTPAPIATPPTRR